MDVFGQEVFFDENGDPPVSYEVINWQLREGKVQHIAVGNFTTSANGNYELLINDEEIIWKTGNLVLKHIYNSSLFNTMYFVQ